MKKIAIITGMVYLAAAFAACTDNRDKNGVTDANNTETSKNETDSTRGIGNVVDSSGQGNADTSGQAHADSTFKR